MYTPQDNRYYVPKVSAKNKLALILSSRVNDIKGTKKHDRVRRDPAERHKLDCLEEELSQSPRLRSVDNETEHFEQTTDKLFASQMSSQFLQLRGRDQQAHYGRRGPILMKS